MQNEKLKKEKVVMVSGGFDPKSKFLYYQVMRKYCKRCGKFFIQNIWNQILCGSKSNKAGCSWLNVTVDRDKRRWKTDLKYRKYQKEYQKLWKKEQRKLKTAYAERQKLLKRLYYAGRGKEVNRRWRKNNIAIILELNRKRLLKKKGVTGSHTDEEWKELKIKHYYSCALCGISEKKLRKIWKGTHFVNLTRDHIIPISKKGTDYIGNIQPLCVSCNAKKHNQIYEK